MMGASGYHSQGPRASGEINIDGGVRQSQGSGVGGAQNAAEQ